MEEEHAVLYMGVAGGPPTSQWNNIQPQYLNWGYLIEWSADCNGDGIVDYGQCRDGSLPDYNGNNIPDCCEQGGPCVVGNYPVQWRVQHGGNGHWYLTLIDSVGMTKQEAVQAAALRGGYLFEGCGQEFDWFYGHTAASSSAAWRQVGTIQFHGPYIGLTKSGNSFGWPSGENCQFDRWDSAEPTNTSTETAVMLFRFGSPPHGRCHDVVPYSVSNSAGIEWSADCNGDGIVDYGQILQGQLIDADANGVPDICEVDPCPGDITDGGTVDATDLSIVLAAWGTNGQGEFQADIDGSGLVDGGDLALVLGGWGPCPN
jgi:hypothetical protein